MNKKILGCVLSIFFTLAIHGKSQYPMYFVTAADERYFPMLLQLIGSIHKIHFNEVGEIAVFDLGLTLEQRNTLCTIKKVVLYEVELTHPDLLKYFKVRLDGSTARGWYAWKPVVIKQALDKFPYILYIDSGIMLKASVRDLFEHIKNNNYFFFTCSHSIKWMTTERVIQYFNLRSLDREFVLHPKTNGISAGFQGLTRAMYTNYVLPMYEHSKNIELFEDDGTTPNGFGTGRHDQALFSIYAALLGLKVFEIHGRDNFPLPSHKLVKFNVHEIIQFKNNKITEAWKKQIVSTAVNLIHWK